MGKLKKLKPVSPAKALKPKKSLNVHEHAAKALKPKKALNAHKVTHKHHNHDHHIQTVIASRSKTSGLK